MSDKTPGRAEPPHLLGRHGPGQRFTGKIERPRNTLGTLQRLWGYLRRQRASLILTAAAVVVAAGSNLLGPYLLARAIDRYMHNHDIPGLGRICLLMFGVYMATSLLTWVQSYVMAGAAQRTVRDIRSDLFTRLQQLPLQFFDQRAHGDLMSRLTNDVENINMVLSDSVTQIVSGILSMVGVTVVMFCMNVRLAAISILTIVLTTSLLNHWIARATRKAFRVQQAAIGTINGFIEETISGQRVVKAYHRELEAMTKFDTANSDLRLAATHAQIYAGLVGPVMNFINNTGLAIVAGMGGVMVVQGVATVGTVAGFINYTRQFGRPLNDIANLYNTIQAAMAGAERVFEVIDEAPETDISDDEAATRDRPYGEVLGDVVFEDVCFSYNPGTPVLRNVSLHARAGMVTAIIGATGAGKTTIINLLTRFYDIDSGAIRIDGRDIRSMRKDALRGELGIVLQDTYLFSGTVRDNIRYGRLDASEEDVVAAAKLANADQFIHRLPHGYDTVLSERASNLSQGQRQLIAIARAILADHSILILDEATSSVDTRTEKVIQAAMRRLMAGRTCFVIAHRLSTIRHADQILVIDRGQIIESGNHEELLALDGFYARLYSRQIRGMSEGEVPDEELVGEAVGV